MNAYLWELLQKTLKIEEFRLCLIFPAPDLSIFTENPFALRSEEYQEQSKLQEQARMEI